MKDRIQKIISQRGVASRRRAEELIQLGRVTCNGQICQLGQSADPDVDKILVDGNPLPALKAHLYLMLHKPKGYVTTLSDEKGRKNAAQLVADCGQRVYPVGRLDMDSEGLLLFTSDGEFANRMMHPKNEIQKIYRVQVSGWSEQALEMLKKPIFLDGYKIKPPYIALEHAQADKATLLITIHEGRNRQIRRMCARAGMQVKRLIRIQEGSLKLGDLPAGKWRQLTSIELKELTYE